MWLILCGFFVCLWIFVRLSLGICRSNVCLIGKTAIVTGANSGLGYQTALNLASRGCKVIMADVANMEESKNLIIKDTNNTNIITKKLDLSSLQSVRDFASDILKTEEKLDILMNNAGIGTSANRKTENGLHPLMQINYFGHFLLTHLLIDLLKKSTPSRIVFTGSLLSLINNLSLKTLNFSEKSCNWFQRLRIYGNSKLAILIASDTFSEKLAGTGVTSNVCHPGFVGTGIFYKSYAIYPNHFVYLFNSVLVKLFAKDPWEGSQTLVHAAVSKKLEKVSGHYFADCKSFYKPWAVHNKNFCKDIWEASEKFVSLTENEKLHTIFN